MADPVRELPIMWLLDESRWSVRVVLDYGDRSDKNGNVRYRWQDGTPVEPDDLDEVASLLEEAAR